MAHFDIPFTDKNTERKMLYRRIEQICADVQARIFDNTVRVRNMQFRDGQYAWNEIDQGPWRPFGDEEYWGSREMYCWFRQTVTIPDAFRGREVVYAVDPMPESGWHSRCFQFILFVDGRMVQGIDLNHTYAILTQCAKGGETFEIALNAYCDDNDFRGQAKLHTFLKTRDTVARDLYYDLSVPLSVAHQYGADDLPRVHILKALKSKKVEAFNFLLVAVRPDYQNKGVDTLFYQDMIPIFAKYNLTGLETTSMLEKNNKILDFFSRVDHIQHKRRRAYLKDL